MPLPFTRRANGFDAVVPREPAIQPAMDVADEADVNVARMRPDVRDDGVGHAAIANVRVVTSLVYRLDPEVAGPRASAPRSRRSFHMAALDST